MPDVPETVAEVAERLGVSPEAATAILEAGLKTAEDRKLAKEAMTHRQRARTAEAKAAELEAKLAEGSPEHAETRHRNAIHETLAELNFVEPKDRRAAVTSLLAVSRLNEKGELELFDPDDESAEPVVADADTVKAILPPEKLLSRASGGSGSGLVPEIRTGRKPSTATEEFDRIISSQAEYEKAKREGKDLKQIEREATR